LERENKRLEAQIEDIEERKKKGCSVESVGKSKKRRNGGMANSEPIKLPLL